MAPNQNYEQLEHKIVGDANYTSVDKTKRLEEIGAKIKSYKQNVKKDYQSWTDRLEELKNQIRQVHEVKDPKSFFNNMVELFTHYMNLPKEIYDGKIELVTGEEFIQVIKKRQSEEFPDASDEAKDMLMDHISNFAGTIYYQGKAYTHIPKKLENKPVPYAHEIMHGLRELVLDGDGSDIKDRAARELFGEVGAMLMHKLLALPEVPLWQEGNVGPAYAKPLAFARNNQWDLIDSELKLKSTYKKLRSLGTNLWKFESNDFEEKLGEFKLKVNELPKEDQELLKDYISELEKCGKRCKRNEEFKLKFNKLPEDYYERRLEAMDAFNELAKASGAKKFELGLLESLKYYKCKKDDRSFNNYRASLDLSAHDWFDHFKASVVRSVMEDLIDVDVNVGTLLTRSTDEIKHIYLEPVEKHLKRRMFGECDYEVFDIIDDDIQEMKKEALPLAGERLDNGGKNAKFG